MNKAQKAGNDLREMDELANLDSPYHRLSPLSKLVMTVLYIIVTVSYGKYELSGVMFMMLFPVLGYEVSGIALHLCFQKLGIVMPLVCAVGILNPFFDRSPLLMLGNIAVSGGVISMLTLMCKGVFCLMASFLLMATTTMEEICRAFRELHFPKLFTSLLLLTYRYISVLLEEVAIMTEAYHLRAPRQKGIEFRAWGSFLGQLLLRSMDRANALYESMELRGYHGEFYYARARESSKASVPVMLLVCLLLLAARLTAPAELLGRIFM